jgi:D-amino peptidase
MKILIFVDMEGISGIPGADFTGIDKPHYKRGQKFMTWDVNACISGCFTGGATEVMVADAHGCRPNILWEDIDPRVSLYQGYGSSQRIPSLEKYESIYVIAHQHHWRYV